MSAQRRNWSNWVVGVAAVTVGVTIAHVLEDFVYGVPGDFGVEVAPAAALLGVAYALHILLIALAARNHPLGYLGNLVYGVGWVLAAGLDHLDDVLFESHYRAGLISKAFEVGIMVSALALAVVSYAAWRSRWNAEDESNRATG